MKLVFLGPPGAGKGTQARIFAEKYGIPQLSTGEVLRAAVVSGTGVGMKARALMDAGQLVSDDIVNQIVAERLDEEDCVHGFILDGYPRTLRQAMALQTLLHTKQSVLDVVIELTVDENILLERMKKRVVDTITAGEKVRSDDNLEVFANRLAEYHRKTFPLSQYYAGTGQLKKVDGMANVDVVTSEIEALLKQTASSVMGDGVAARCAKPG